MAGKKSSGSSSVSMGGRQKRKLAHEASRQARFARRKEAGKVYEYKPNPYKVGTPEYYEEKNKRIEKAKSSRTNYAITTSIFRKLQNQLEKDKVERAKAKSDTAKKKS